MQISKLIPLLLFCSLLLIRCSSAESNVSSNLKSANQQVLGSSAEDLLAQINYKSLRLEIVSVEGFAPLQESIDGFQTFLEARLFKPDGITITQRTVPSSQLAPFTIDEIRDIEDDTRTLFNTGDEITVYIYFADGSNEDDEENSFTLGVAYRNTSVVIYEQTLRDLSEGLPSVFLRNIETATLNHEFAHLMGLVNIGTPLQSEHEDEDENGHCNVSGCLMEASIQLGLGIPELDPACITDLQANGGR